ncbi:hypothetical protein A1O1_01586 [Capronia coronata CBS 617.96]|uniref:Inner kinetochore subunit AME1 domain-containing protein n=1 Tax=Capronia coronata CBS 617.96 TaxID=1182541 RepID=W9Z3D3_9EURO|nr:uncharacterized protein A1O1_01586 [Capronia coronata CBS 617.96]EXJ96460.1 hypothetical protein A1O1_01586 [Capronia coronata CBS 617.96]
MRQRGAGSRAVAAADFGLDFGLVDDKQESLLARQSDAEFRTVENTDFGLSIPYSARSLRSKTGNSPHSRRLSSRYPSQTPGSRNRTGSSIRSARHNPQQVEHNGADAPQLGGNQSVENVHQAKRRRLSPAAVTPIQLSAKPPAAASTGGIRSGRRSSREVFTVAEDNDGEEGLEPLHTPGAIAFQRIQDSPLFFPEHEPNKENDNATPAYQREDGSLLASQGVKGGQPSILYPRNSVSRAKEDALGLVINNARIPEAKDGPEGTEAGGRSNDTHVMSLEKSLPTSNNTGSSSHKRRKKRKSVILVRKKRRSSGVNEVSLQQTEIPSEAPGSSGSLETPQPAPSQSTSRVRARRYANTKSRDKDEDSPPPSRSGSPTRTDGDDDETYIQESSPEPQTPALSKKVGDNIHRGATRTQNPRSSKGGTSRPTFPILTHRLTNSSRLPTIDEANENDVHSENAFANRDDLERDRSEPNAVDVLAQICRETIENCVRRMSEDMQPSERAALKVRRTALEEFGRDLNDELFELSEAAENRIILEARVRKSKREKAFMQTEWIELRKERERIALECDAVRRRHWQCEDDARERWDLSEAARRAELELERNDPANEAGLECLLRSVLNNVSSASEEGGLLDRVKSFNAQLENTALFLEGRHGH